jgi:hypothetical protein
MVRVAETPLLVGGIQIAIVPGIDIPTKPGCGRQAISKLIHTSPFWDCRGAKSFTVTLELGVPLAVTGTGLPLPSVIARREAA